MSYLLNKDELVELLNELRWHSELPEHVNGFNCNLVIETAIDMLNSCYAKDVTERGEK